MGRQFLYARVSTVDQFTLNQVQQVKDAGFHIEDHRIIQEEVSGKVPAQQRKGFSKLLERMEAGDTLVVTKLDRLGRDTSDVKSTVELLAGLGMVCPALRGQRVKHSALSDVARIQPG